MKAEEPVDYEMRSALQETQALGSAFNTCGYVEEDIMFGRTFYIQTTVEVLTLQATIPTYTITGHITLKCGTLTTEYSFSCCI